MINFCLSGPVAQLVRALPCHGRGHRFEPDLGRFGVLAQLGEHLPYKQRVIGSSPIGSIYPNGFGIEFFQNMESADVAQLAEQLICNQQVTGSIPAIGFYKWVDSRVAKGDRL